MCLHFLDYTSASRNAKNMQTSNKKISRQSPAPDATPTWDPYRLVAIAIGAASAFSHQMRIVVVAGWIVGRIWLDSLMVAAKRRSWGLYVGRRPVATGFADQQLDVSASRLPYREASTT
jgi:hypothetical protein